MTYGILLDQVSCRAYSLRFETQFKLPAQIDREQAIRLVSYAVV